MPTKDMSTWNTAISEVISTGDEEEIMVRGQPLSRLIGKVSFAEMMFLMLRGSLPSPAQSRVLDALLVASMEHGIAPPSMISRCFASYGTSIQAAVAGGVLAFGDRMGGLGEQLAQTMVAHLAAHNPGNQEIDDGTLDAIAVRIVEDARDKGQRVPGYGIPLHGADPTGAGGPGGGAGARHPRQLLPPGAGHRGRLGGPTGRQESAHEPGWGLRRGHPGSGLSLAKHAAVSVDRTLGLHGRAFSGGTGTRQHLAPYPRRPNQL